jgi:hypothetical protein
MPVAARCRRRFHSGGGRDVAVVDESLEETLEIRMPFAPERMELATKEGVNTDGKAGFMRKGTMHFD